MFKLAFAFLFVPALLVVKLPFPRRFKGWLVALVSLTAVAVVSIAPMMRSRAQSSTTYTFTDLGEIDVSGTNTRAFSINGCSQIAGYSSLADNSKRPFFRPSGTLLDLGVLSGNGTASSLNNSGYVVGNSPGTPSSPRAFIWRDDNNDGDSDAGEMKLLLPAGTESSAEDINDNGQVVGWVLADSPGSLGFNGFVWGNNSFQLISGAPTYTSLRAFGINNAGTIVGEADGPNGVRAIVLRSGVFTEIGVFSQVNGGSGAKSFALAVSEADHVVGWAETDPITASPPRRAFIWTDAGGLKDLGTPNGQNSIAYGVGVVNSFVQVVGTSFVGVDPETGNARAFVWEDDGDGNPEAGETKDLNTPGMVDLPSGWVLQQARGINLSGQIVGFGTNGSETRAFLLTPSTFVSNCTPAVTVTVNPASVGEDGSTNLIYTFARSANAAPLTVNFSTSGTATRAVDYAVSGTGITYDPNTGSGTVAFAAGEITKNVTVDPATDSAVETNETVVLTTAAGPGYIAGTPTSATGTITNDDTDVIVTLAPTSVAESGTPNLVYTFTRTGVTTGALTVSFSVAGTATLNTDYGQSGAATFSASAGTVTLSAGSSSATVTLDPTPDATLEGDENVTLTVTSGSGYNVSSPSSATGTITPDAPIVYVEAGTENNPIPNAVAVDSVTFVRGPFKLTNDWNLTPSDRATRVILVTSNLGMTQADLATPNLLSVRIAGYGTLPIENVGAITGVTGLSASYIVVRLPPDLGPNPSPGPSNLTLTVKMGSAESNAATLCIIP